MMIIYISVKNSFRETVFILAYKSSTILKTAQNRRDLGINVYQVLIQVLHILARDWTFREIRTIYVYSNQGLSYDSLPTSVQK